jgi:hypothetical protein
MYLRLDWDPNFLKLIFLTQQQIACNSHVIFTRERERERRVEDPRSRLETQREDSRGDPRPELLRFRPEVGRRLGDLLIHSLDVSINTIHPTTPSLDLINGVFCFLFFQLCEIEGEFFAKNSKISWIYTSKTNFTKTLSTIYFFFKMTKGVQKRNTTHHLALFLWEISHKCQDKIISVTYSQCFRGKNSQISKK